MFHIFSQIKVLFILLFIVRLGNLLLETGTLLLVGRRVNKTVSLLPQVAKKLKNYFDKLPLEPIDRLFFFRFRILICANFSSAKILFECFFANNSISTFSQCSFVTWQWNGKLYTSINFIILFIFETWCQRPFICQTMNSVRSRSLGSKFYKFHFQVA